MWTLVTYSFDCVFRDSRFNNRRKLTGLRWVAARGAVASERVRSHVVGGLRPDCVVFLRGQRRGVEHRPASFRGPR